MTTDREDQTMIYHASRDGYVITRTYDAFPDGRRAVVMSHPELPGCSAYGDADDDEGVVGMLDGARRAWIACSRRTGSIVPPPTVAIQTMVTFGLT